MPPIYLLRASMRPTHVVAIHRLSRQRRRPSPLRCAPLQPFEQHRQLRRRQHHCAVFRHGPREAALLQPLGEQAETLPIPVQNFGEVASAKFCTDRKSTRLNSSHQIISYAVFCLKKKKELNTIRYAWSHTKYDHHITATKTLP